MFTFSSLKRLVSCAMVSAGVLAISVARQNPDGNREAETATVAGDQAGGSGKSGSRGVATTDPNDKTACDCRCRQGPCPAPKLSNEDQPATPVNAEPPRQWDNFPWHAGPGQTGPPAIEFFPLQGQSQIEREITEKLSQRVSLEFVETPFGEVINFLKDYTGVNIVPNKGIGSDTPASVHVKNIPFRSALNILLEPYNLTYLIKDDALKITSRLDADNELMHLIYPVGDLCANADYDTLIQIIEQVIDPNSWSSVGGPATVQPVETLAAIVINQTQSVHAQVLDCLRVLRDVKAFDDGRHPKSNADAVREELQHRLRVLREVERIRARERSERNAGPQQTSSRSAAPVNGGSGGF